MTSNQKWTLAFIPKANKSFQKLSKPVQKRIQKYMNQVIDSGTPKNFGKPLEDNMKGFWRYRVGDYRLICEIRDNELIVVVIKVSHRAKVYTEH